jgi:hypothetical protein
MYLVSNCNKGTSRTFTPQTEEDNQTVFSSLDNKISFIIKRHQAILMRIRPITGSQIAKACVRKSENFYFRSDVCPKTPEE